MKQLQQLGHRKETLDDTKHLLIPSFMQAEGVQVRPQCWVHGQKLRSCT